jgi:photosystem II stability/assembly factor-like uncharacterized protein
MHTRTRFTRNVILAAAAALLPIHGAAAQRNRTAEPARPAPLDSTAFAGMRWRHIGPEGNRVSSVVGVDGDRTTYYAGAASGGLWKTIDGGLHWRPIFDDQPVSSIGALAVAPSDANVVWVGTGEPFIRSNISIGWGVWRSTDAGKSFTKMGLDNTGRIARIVVHPTNPDIVYVAAMGHNYGPQPERGIYRTMDAGKTWERVLFVNDSTGASDLVMDPNNPRILFAGTWQVEIHTWGRTSGGAGSGIWMSRDAGTTWKRLTASGLPTKMIGKVGLAMSKSNSNRIYALIETGDGVPAVNMADPEKGRLWRSDDGGTNWTMVSIDRQVAGRTHYYNRMAAMPDNAEEAYFLTANWAKTLDGGRTITDPPFAETPYGDHHDIWIDQTNGNRMIVSHDGGVSITENRGKNWNRIALPIAQMYHVEVDNRVPYYVYGNRQDGPSARGPSNSKLGALGDFGGGIPRGLWYSVGGGESGWATPDPVDSNIVWSSASGFGSVGGIVVKHDLRTGVSQNIEIWPEATIGHAAADVKYRFVWTFPLTISPHDHNRVYVGSQFVHQTSDGGRTWKLISQDLTRNDKTRLVASGGLTPDNIGVEYSGVVFAITESRLKAGLIWAGTNDGKVHVTQDGGTTWTDVTPNIPGLLPWGTISNIEASRFDAGTAYMSVDGHQVNNRDPWIYKTTDFGKTWKLLVNGIPKSPLSYVHVVREDPARRGLLYAGTENGIYVSFSDGETWQSLQNNLPAAPVYWITVQENFRDLAIATYGRGFWILDDISRIRELAPDVTAKAAHFFAPRSAYRFRPVEAIWAPLDDPVAGDNPPNGAPLDFWLSTAPKDSIAISISDASGKVVRTMKVNGKAGGNRAWWDLNYDLTKEPKVRTMPLFTPELRYAPEGRAAPGVGRLAILAPPGTYSVQISVAGQQLRQPLTILKDPNSGGSLEDIATQTAFMTDLTTDLNAAVDMINALEVVRSQVGVIKSSLASDSTVKDVRTASDSIDRKLLDVEEQLMQMRITGRGQDVVRWPMQVAEKLLYLAGSAAGSDHAPAAQHREVQQLLRERVRQIKTQFDQVMSRDLEAYKTLLRQRNIQHVIIS